METEKKPEKKLTGMEKSVEKKPEKKLSVMEKFESDLELLGVERGKHEKAIRECSAQRRELQKDFNDTKLARKKKVDSVLEENFLDQSEKGLIDKILTTTIKEPKLHQLQDNIAKLQAQEDWHRSRLADISKQEKDIRGKIRKLKSGEALKKAYSAYNKWFDSVSANEKAWFEFKDAVQACHGYQMDYTLSFAEQGLSDDRIFFDIMSSRLRPAVLLQMKQADLIRKLSNIRQIEDNKWYVHPGKFNERRSNRPERIDPLRGNFMP